MFIHRPKAFLVALLCGVLSVGCEQLSSGDQGIAAARSIDAMIVRSRRVLAEAAIVTPEDCEKTAEALRNAATSMTPPAGATAGQKLSLKMMASQLHREAGRLDAAAAEHLETSQRHRCDAVLANIGAMAQLAEAGKTQESETVAAIETLAARQKEIESQSMALSQLVDVATKEAGETKIRITELRQRIDASAANQMALHQQAMKATPAHATTLARQSDGEVKQSVQWRSQMSLLELDYGTQEFNRSLIAARQSHLQNEATHLAASQADVEAIMQDRQQAVAALAQRLQALQQDAGLQAKTLMETSAGPLKTLLERASESFDRAASDAQAGQSVSGALGESARLSIASAQLSKATMFERRAMGVELESRAFGAMAVLDSAGNWGSAATNAQTERNSCLTKAVESLDVAIQSLADSEVPGNLKLRATETKARLSPMLPAAAAADAPAASDATPSDAPASETPASDTPVSDAPPASEQPTSEPPASEPPASEPPASPPPASHAV